jgi:hypothetical protein
MPLRQVWTAIRRRLAQRAKRRGNRARAVGRLESALAHYHSALRWMPRYAQAANNIGLVLNESGQEAPSFAWYRRALDWQPDLSAARWNWANALLSQGDFEAGWRAYEERMDPQRTHNPEALRTLLTPFGDIPLWRGEALDGRRILLWTEQGLGDSILMARYLPLFAQRFGVRPDLWCEAPLARLLATLPQLGTVSTTLRDPDYPFHCPLLSLPGHFQTRLDTIPSANAPYLHIPKEAQQRWQARLDALPGRKVGLVWRGHTLGALPWGALQPLLSLPGISWVSLQHGEPSPHRPPPLGALHDWMPECADLFDTAALISTLDAVVSIDSAVAHLAAALGRPLIVLCALKSEWRWRSGGVVSPWYRHAQPIWQEAPGQWDSAIARAAECLMNSVVQDTQT